MDDAVNALILDLLEWVAAGDRSYEQVMEAWRTSCPRLPVWEEANERGLIEEDSKSVIRITRAGVEYLQARRFPSSSA